MSGSKFAYVITESNAMQNMTEVYYYNNKKELQKLELYNISSSEFLQKQPNSCFNVLCVIENGSIVYTSVEFMIIEEGISVLMADLINEPN